MNPHLPALRLATVCTVLVLATGGSHPAEESAAEPPALTGTQLRNLPAPDFRLPTLSGNPASLERYSGWILVLHFFGSEDEQATTLLEETEYFRARGREHEIAYLGISTIAMKH